MAHNLVRLLSESLRWLHCCARLPTRNRMLRIIGRHTLNLVQAMGDFALFTGISFRSAVGSRKIIRRIARAAFEQGTRCLPVILIVGMFTGLVLGLQGYYVLNRFGSESLLGALVSLSLVRELGPVLAALTNQRPVSMARSWARA